MGGTSQVKFIVVSKQLSEFNHVENRSCREKWAWSNIDMQMKNYPLEFFLQVLLFLYFITFQNILINIKFKLLIKKNIKILCIDLGIIVFFLTHLNVDLE